MPFSPADAASRQPLGVCWSGIESYPETRLVPSPEALAAAEAAYRKALAIQEEQVAAYARSQGRVYVVGSAS